jgi:hypothetical protein
MIICFYYFKNYFKQLFVKVSSFSALNIWRKIVLFLTFLQLIIIRNFNGSKNAEYVRERSDIMRKFSLRQMKLNTSGILRCIWANLHLLSLPCMKQGNAYIEHVWFFFYSEGNWYRWHYSAGVKGNILGPRMPCLTGKPWANGKANLGWGEEWGGEGGWSERASLQDGDLIIPSSLLLPVIL